MNVLSINRCMTKITYVFSLKFNSEEAPRHILFRLSSRRSLRIP